MLEFNLFHEQQKLQREKDYDPVRLTILGGILIVLGVLLWASGIYFKMGPLRAKLVNNKAKLAQRSDELTKLGTLTELAKIQSQAASLRNRIDYRTLMGSCLSTFRDITPASCQLSVLRTTRGMATSQTSRPGKNGPVYSNFLTPTMDVAFEVHTQARTKVEVLRIRDDFLETLRKSPQLKLLVRQVADESGGTSNEILTISSVTQDPKAGEKAMGIFEFKVPLLIKDKAKEVL